LEVVRVAARRRECAAATEAIGCQKSVAVVQLLLEQRAERQACATSQHCAPADVW
jgi:hypothetical protein